MEKPIKRKEYVDFEMTGYRGIDSQLAKAQTILKEVRATSAKGGVVDRDYLSSRLLSYVERINKLATRYERDRSIKDGPQTTNEKFEQARKDALQTIWQAYQWVTVKVDASTLGEMDDSSHADVFLHTRGSKNPNMDFDYLPDSSPYASEVQIVSLDAMLDNAKDEETGTDLVVTALDHIDGLEWEAAPAEGFDDDEVQGFWRDPRDPKWSKLSGGNH